ncbi:shikimate kinase [Sphingobacteriaceae bacterium]|nr:shikimate kinase [Sphingobacteriaceae bacterium]
MKLKQHVFLTGFMGSGKSTAGKALGTLLKTRFIDLDDYLEKKEARTIPEIFEEEGEEKFRELEKKYLLELLKLKDPHVISLGGGTICFYDNLETVKKNGQLIYIDLPTNILVDRIKESSTTRPLLKDLTNEELTKNIDEILSVRKPFYEQAHIIINGLLLTPQLIQQKLLGSVKEHTK